MITGRYALSKYGSNPGSGVLSRPKYPKITGLFQKSKCMVMEFSETLN